MSVIPSQALPQVYEDLAVPPPRYAQMVAVSECAYHGVNNPTDIEANASCDAVWQLPQRNMVVQALAESQEELEDELMFPLSSKWYTETNRRWKTDTVILKRGHIVAFGQKATLPIGAAGAAVNHAADPAIVGPIVTTVTDEAEVRVYHPGTAQEIYPSVVTIALGSVTIQIPRCRLVALANADNPVEGWDYTDTGVLGPFTQTVDVTRVYNDTTTQAAPHMLKCDCTQEAITGSCAVLDNARLGVAKVLVDCVSSMACTCGCGRPVVDMYYRAGWAITAQQEEMLVRLAHSKMADEPCDCDSAQMMWRRDRHVPEVLTAERINCPFGLNDGAWIVWQFSGNAALRRGGIM